MMPATTSRRQFLSRLGCGFGALAMEAMLRDGQAKQPAVSIDPVSPMRARLPHFAPKAKSVIFLFMVGGPGSVDTFDYKPLLQKMGGQKVPESFRKAVEATRFANVFHGCKQELLASPWEFKPYGQSGLMVSSLMARTAEHADDLCIIHSMQAGSNNHGPASIQLHTGEITGGKASLGSWATYGLGSETRTCQATCCFSKGGRSAARRITPTDFCRRHSRAPGCATRACPSSICCRRNSSRPVRSGRFQRCGN
jgi:hypothetical protein